MDTSCPSAEASSDLASKEPRSAGADDSRVFRRFDGLEREQQVRLELESVHRRQAFLARVSALLAPCLDCRASLAEVARLVVPEWADGCVIDLFPSDSRGEALETERVALVLHERTEVRPEALPGGEPLVTGPLACHPWVTHLASRTTPWSPAMPGEPSEGTGVVSGMRLLLRGRGRDVGVLSLLSIRPERSAALDAPLFEALAQGIAAAVDAAHLHQQLQEAVRWRDELLALVSHELMSPLLVMRLNSEMLLTQLHERGGPEPEQERLVKPLLQVTRQMRVLVTSLLERARVEGKLAPLAPRPQQVEDLIAEALGVLQPLAQDKHQQLRVTREPRLPRVSADRERLLQVFNNLVGNAIKFTPEGGTITLGAWPVEGMVRLWVKDSGPGTSPADLPHLFERFWRAANASERGTGLGLHIAKSLVTAHGGTLWAESRVGEGSTFFFTLPIAGD